MSVGDSFIERAKAISVLRTEMYLRAKGWAHIGSVGEVARIWRKDLPDSRIETLRAPARADLSDYASAIAHVLQVVSLTSATPLERVLQEVEDAFEDVSRWRIAVDDGKPSSISLEAAAATITHLRSAYLWGAVAAAQTIPGKKVFAPNPPDRAKQFLHATRFGHTEHGSFVFTVRVPVVDVEVTPTKREPPDALEQSAVQPTVDAPGEAQPPLFPEAIPEHDFSRTAMVCVIQALDAANQASQLPAADQESGFESTLQHGVSANLLEALSHLLESAPSSAVEVAPTWSPLLPEPTEAPRKVVFMRRQRSAFTDAAARFRLQVGTLPRRRTGWVHRLERERSLEVPGTVVIETREAGKVIRFRTILEPSSYRIAVSAHRYGWIIEVTGTLMKERKTYYMLDPSNFHRADGPELEIHDAIPPI